MGDKNLQRKDFLKKIIGIKNTPTIQNEELLEATDDPLFEKYARKTLGQRQYSTTIGNPNVDGSFAARVGTVNSGLTPYAGAWTIMEVNHLLRRASYGVKKTDATSLLALTPSAAVDAMFTFTAAPVLPSPTPLYFNTANYADTLGTGTGAGTANNPYVTGGVAQGADWTASNIIGYPPFGPQYSRRISLEYWQWGVCINDATSIREKMQQFWYHFIPVGFESVENSEDNSGTLINDYMKSLRTNCLGNFKTLIKSIAKTPAMLVYLSNQYSTASAPNENFARELMELFTMGKVPTQNYTEPDIIAASKVLSGWRVPSFISAYPFAPGFNATYHNQTNKTFSSFFGNTVINNQAGANGANELDIFFEMLFTQQATTIARYICRRLYRFFVYYDIDSNVETKVIEPLADLLITSQWEMLPVVKTLFKSEHFFDLANRGVMIKSPIDYMTGIVRTFNINTNTSAGVDKQYFVWRFLQDFSNDSLGQGYGNPPNVAGWKAYYQEPTYYQNWINSETIQKRATLITALLNGYTPYQSGLNLKVNLIQFVQQFQTAAGVTPAVNMNDPNTLINEVVKYLFAVDLPAAYKAEVKTQELLLGQTNDGYWTNLWNAYLANPNTTNFNYVNDKLKGLMNALLQLAEFQLM
jgi:uncharacterized protein (DUF1800 family)